MLQLSPAQTQLLALGTVPVIVNYWLVFMNLREEDQIWKRCKENGARRGKKPEFMRGNVPF